jgi:hypothetical protein
MPGPVALRRDRDATSGLDSTASGTRQVPIMIASSGFGLLALFSLLSILLGEDRRRHTDPSETYEFGAPWTR